MKQHEGVCVSRQTQSPECCFIRHGLSVVDFISSTSVKFIVLLHKKPLFSTNFDTGKIVVMRNYVNCNCDVIHKLYRWPLWRHGFIIWYVRNMQELLSLVETKAHRPIINKLVQNFLEWQNIFIRHGWSCSSTAIVEEYSVCHSDASVIFRYATRDWTVSRKCAMFT